MKALLWKDFYATKSSIIFMAVLVAAMMGIGAYAGGESGLFSVYSVLFISMMPFTSQTLDERAEFPRFALSTPISRQELVLSKYVYGLLLALLAFLINAADLLLLRVGGITEIFPLLLIVALALLPPAPVLRQNTRRSAIPAPTFPRPTGLHPDQ